MHNAFSFSSLAVMIILVVSLSLKTRSITRNSYFLLFIHLKGLTYLSCKSLSTHPLPCVSTLLSVNLLFLQNWFSNPKSLSYFLRFNLLLILQHHVLRELIFYIYFEEFLYRCKRHIWSHMVYDLNHAHVAYLAGRISSFCFWDCHKKRMHSELDKCFRTRPFSFLWYNILGSKSLLFSYHWINLWTLHRFSKCIYWSWAKKVYFWQDCTIVGHNRKLKAQA